MKNLTTVEGSQTTNDLDKYIPDLLLFDVGLALLVVTYFLEHVSVVSIFHNQA